MNADHAHGHQPTRLTRAGDPPSPPITANDIAHQGEPRCPRAMDECPAIACQRKPHGPGMCFNVRPNPYRAAYWLTEGAHP